TTVMPHPADPSRTTQNPQPIPRPGAAARLPTGAGSDAGPGDHFPTPTCPTDAVTRLRNRP
ncbi:hypothetical protein ACWC2M_35560, partial [Streptomyces sp. NPDC001761]